MKDKSKPCLYVAAILIVVILPSRGSCEEGEDGAHPLRVFDVSALVKPVKDFPGPRFEMSPGRALESMMRDIPGAFAGELEPHRPTVLTTIDLEELIKESDSIWENPPEGVRMTIVRNRLYVRGPGPSLERLRKLLGVLEKEAAKSFHVRAIVVEAPKGKGRFLVGDSGAVLEEGAVKKSLMSLAGAGGRTLADASVVALNGQRVHLVDGEERTFLVDYDVQVAKEVAEADPIVEVFRDGIVLDVRPTASPSGESVRLDLHVAYAQFEKETARFDPANPRLGPVDLPRITGFRMESSLALPSGRFIVLGPLLPRPMTPNTTGKDDKGGESKSRSMAGDVYLLLQAKAISP